MVRKLLHRHPHQQHHARPGQDQLRLRSRKAPQECFLRLQAPSGQGDHLPLERQAQPVPPSKSPMRCIAIPPFLPIV